MEMWFGCAESTYGSRMYSGQFRISHIYLLIQRSRIEHSTHRLLVLPPLTLVALYTHIRKNTPQKLTTPVVKKVLFIGKIEIKRKRDEVM